MREREKCVEIWGHGIESCGQLRERERESYGGYGFDFCCPHSHCEHMLMLTSLGKIV